MVVLCANPLDGIRNTRQIVYVVKDGIVYSGEDAARVHPERAPRFYFQRP